MVVLDISTSDDDSTPTSIQGFASSTWDAGIGLECGNVISSGPNGAGTLGKSGGKL